MTEKEQTRKVYHLKNFPLIVEVEVPVNPVDFCDQTVKLTTITAIICGCGTEYLKINGNYVGKFYTSRSEAEKVLQKKITSKIKSLKKQQEKISKEIHRLESLVKK